MWISKKELNKLYDKVIDAQARCTALEQVNVRAEEDINREREKLCPNGCMGRVEGWCGWYNTKAVMRKVDKFIICPECGYTEPCEKSKYTSIPKIKFGLENLERKVDELISKLPKKAKKYKRPAKKKRATKKKKK